MRRLTGGVLMRYMIFMYRDYAKSEMILAPHITLFRQSKFWIGDTLYAPDGVYRHHHYLGVF